MTIEKIKDYLPWLQGIVNALFVAFFIGSVSWARSIDHNVTVMRYRLDAISDLAADLRMQERTISQQEGTIKVLESVLIGIEQRTKRIEEKVDRLQNISSGHGTGE